MYVGVTVGFMTAADTHIAFFFGTVASRKNVIEISHRLLR
jgi:hypothetical protein